MNIVNILADFQISLSCSKQGQLALKGPLGVQLVVLGGQGNQWFFWACLPGLTWAPIEEIWLSSMTAPGSQMPRVLKMGWISMYQVHILVLPYNCQKPEQWWSSPDRLHHHYSLLLNEFFSQARCATFLWEVTMSRGCKGIFWALNSVFLHTIFLIQWLQCSVYWIRYNNKIVCDLRNIFKKLLPHLHNFRCVHGGQVGESRFFLYINDFMFF